MLKPTKRKAFNFLRSYFDVFNELDNDKDKLDFLTAIINKQFLDEDPKGLNFIVNLCYESQRHQIESSVKGWERASNNTLRTTPPTPLVTTPPTPKQEEEEKEKEKEEVKEKVKSSIDENKFSPEIRNLSKLLFSLILQNNDKAKQPNFNSWDEHIDKLHRIDKYELKQIEYVIKWCQQDNFWKSNILSTKKLRDKFAGLVVKIKSEKEKKVAQKKESFTEKWNFNELVSNDQKQIG